VGVGVRGALSTLLRETDDDDDGSRVGKTGAKRERNTIGRKKNEDEG